MTDLKNSKRVIQISIIISKLNYEYYKQNDKKM